MSAEQATQVTPEAQPKAEKQTNCLGCGKPIKKIKRYYRDGKFYCAKKCWRAYLAKAKEEKK
jgi:recombinational DNA repair protein (RecF pathway)